MRFNFPNRTICSVLEEMRKCYGSYNFAAIASLIEECQMLANRMEARLENAHDYEHQREELRKIKKEINELEKKKEALEEENNAATKSN